MRQIFAPLKSVFSKMGNANVRPDEITESQVLGPINYLDKKCFIISKENYEHFLKTSDKPILGQLNFEVEYCVISKETYKNFLNDHQQSTSNLQFMRQQIFGPINYQNKEIYAIDEALVYSNNIPKQKILGVVYINDDCYAISEEAYEEYLEKNDQQRKQQLQQFMQQLVRPINHNNTECYGISKENYEYILEIIPVIRINKLMVNDVCCIISKTLYDKYLQMQNERIKPFLRKLILEQKIHKGRDSYLISEENYNLFLAKIQNPQQKVKEKEVCHEKYYAIDGETYNQLQNTQNDQQIPEQQSLQIVGQLSHLNKESYVMDKENYDYFFKISNQQPEGQIKIKEEYSVISKEIYKEIYDDILRQNPSRNLQLMQRQILGPVNCLNRETYMIGEAYRKFLTDDQIIRTIKINKEYYIIDKESYDKFHDRLRFQRFVQRLNVKPINHNNTEYYGISKESYIYISDRVPNEQVVKDLNVEEYYYVIRKDLYISYFQQQHDQRIQKFMGRYIYDHKGHYLISKENYDNFFKNIINNKDLRQMKFTEKYHGINKEAYDKNILQIDRQKDQTPEQQVELILQKFMQQNFTQRQVFGQLNYLGNECYVIDKENYNHFLRQIQTQVPNQQEVIEINHVRPISVDYFLIIKEAYEYYLGVVDFNSRNNSTKEELEELLNSITTENKTLKDERDNLKVQILTQTQAHKEECDNLKAQNEKLRGEATKYQSELGEATSFHLGNQDSNSTSQLSGDIRNLHEKLVKFCNVKRDVVINPEGIKELMKNYDCSITDEISKNLISGVLERAVIETITEKTESYFNYDGNKKKQRQDLTKDSNTTDSDEQLSAENPNTTEKKNSNAIDKVKQQKNSETKNLNATDKVKQQKGVETKNSNTADNEKRWKDLEAKNFNILGNEKQRPDLEAKNFNILGNEKQRPDLEAKIHNTTEKLLQMTNLFTEIRIGTDRVSEAVPTKLRQQIYGVLGNRGFSKTREDENNSKEHPFIMELRDDVLKLMNRYRKFKNPKRLEDNEKAINEIIRDVINIFFFRLNVQEPIAAWDWLPKDTVIDKLRMEASWDDNETNLHFDVCAFPLIGSNIGRPDDEKVIFPAQVVMNTSD